MKGYGVVQNQGLAVGYGKPGRRWPLLVVGFMAVMLILGCRLLLGCGTSPSSGMNGYSQSSGRTLNVFPAGEGWFSYPDPNKNEGIIKRLFRCPADSGEYCIVVNLPSDGLPVVFWDGEAYVEMRLDGKLITWGNAGELGWPGGQE